MTSDNEFISDERLWNAIEDVSHWLANEGNETTPPVIIEKIMTIMASVKRNERNISIEMGTAGKGGCVKVYFDPLDMENTTTILQNTYIARTMMQELHKIEDINPQKK